MLDSNRNLYKDKTIKFPEYLDNHLLIMGKMKESIIKMETIDYEFLNSNIEINIADFRRGIQIVKFNLN